MASAASRPPCTTLKTPSGSPASRSSSAMRPELSGTCSDGFRTKVLPSAMALGKDQCGTIDGKLNGLIEATTPSGCRSSRHSTPRLTSITSPDGDLWQRAGEFGQLDGLENLGLGLALDLAVLLGNQRAELGEMALEQRLVAVEDLHPLLDRRRGPGGERAARGRDRLIHLGGPAQRDAADHRSGGRAQHVQEAGATGHRLPADPVANVRVCASGPPIGGRRGGAGVEGGHGFHPGRGGEEGLGASEGVCSPGSGMSMWAGGRAAGGRRYVTLSAAKGA